MHASGLVSLLSSAVWGAAVVGAAYGAYRLTTISPQGHEVLPFQSGWSPSQHALSRFHARWYPLTVVFLAFDVEMLFMYPWSLVVAAVGTSAVVEMFAFLGALMLAVLWAWREGALRWT